MRFEYASGQYAMSEFSGKTLSLQGKGATWLMWKYSSWFFHIRT